VQGCWDTQVELQDAKHSHTDGGMVSLIVKDARKRCVLRPFEGSHEVALGSRHL
jgi:hypothetical protein